MTAHDVSFSVWGVQYSFPDPLAFLSFFLEGRGEGTGFSDHKMPVVAYGVMFRAKKDLFAGTPLVGFINILDSINVIFGQKNGHLQC